MPVVKTQKNYVRESEVDRNETDAIMRHRCHKIPEKIYLELGVLNAQFGINTG